MAECIETRVLLAKQAILDKDLRTHGFELLFRGEFIDGDRATSEVLLNAFNQLDIRDVVGSGRAFVNFTRTLLEHPPSFDRDRLVIEVLEDIAIDDALLARLGTLRDAGYCIALDDFVLHPGYEVLLPYARIAKLDVLALDDAKLEAHAERLRAANLVLLAEKVEDQAMFRRCESLGFELFQGFFFAKPESVTGRSLPASKLAVLQLLATLHNPQVEFEDLQNAITQDAALSYRLLRLLNSAAFALRSPVDSITGAMTLLGITQIRQWASMLAMTSMSDKPHALTLLTAARASACEHLGAEVGPGAQSGAAFTVGLLSTMDAFFDRPKAEVLASLPLGDAIKRAVLERDNELGRLLELVCARERGEVAPELMASAGVSARQLDAAYWHGQHFARELVRDF